MPTAAMRGKPELGLLVVDDAWRSAVAGDEVDAGADVVDEGAVAGWAADEVVLEGGWLLGGCWLLMSVDDDVCCAKVWDCDSDEEVGNGAPAETVLVVRVVRVLGPVAIGSGTGSTPGAEVGAGL